MLTNNKFFIFNCLYIYFIFLALLLFFFSTTKVFGKAFNINDVAISKPFEINFDKNEVIDQGFKAAFFELISIIVNSTDKKKIERVKLSEIKGMIESFTVKEENFVNEVYNVNLGVSFNKKKIFKYLEDRNIFPSMPIRSKFLFIPIIIDEDEKSLLVFNNNKFFDKWNGTIKKNELIDYILPTEDLEDLNFIKNKYEMIEQYDFKEITDKYYLDNSIIALIFKNEKDVRVLSKITLKDNMILKNQSFSNNNLENIQNIENIIGKLKVIYEDYWKNSNLINTSIKLPLNIKLDSSENSKILKFEEILNEADLIYDFFILKFDKNFVYYQIIFNGTPALFLKIMENYNYSFDVQNRIWILK